jgi:hypothetical protein
MTYKIRKWCYNDFDILLDLGETMWSEGAYADMTFDREKVKKTFTTLLSTGKGVGFVAEKQDKIIGGVVVYITKYFFNDEKMCSDLALYVDPKERKSIFVPIRLINAATEWAKEQGAREFRPGSTVEIASDKVEKLYKFMKFETVGHLFKKRL